MAFSVSKSRPFRSLGLYKSSGKHAAPKGSVPAPRPAPENTGSQDSPEQSASHHPAHAATSPRLTSAGAPAKHQPRKAAAAEQTAA